MEICLPTLITTLLTELPVNEMTPDIEIRMIKTHEITLPKDLRRDADIENQIIKFIINKNELLHCFYFPVVHQENDSFRLVGRPWAYSYWIDKAVDQFPCVVILSKQMADFIIDYDKSETMMLARCIKTISKKPSRATETRHKAISSKQTCPFCTGPLRQSRNKEKVDNVGFKITCENKSNKKINDGKGCGFEAALSDMEIPPFEEYKFPTDMWLQQIHDIKCPLCGDAIFLRIVHKALGKKEYYERCASHYRRDSKCAYKKKVSGPNS